MPEVTVQLERSGFVDLSGGGDADGIGCIFMLAGRPHRHRSASRPAA